MRHFVIATDTRTGRKYFRGLSVRERYVAERNLARALQRPHFTNALESFPTVAAAVAAIHAHNEPLPYTVKKGAA